MRDLALARATADRTLAKARQHLQGFLLRRDLLRLRRFCRLGWRTTGNAPRRARPAPRRNRMPNAGCRMLRRHRSQPMPAPRTTPRIATPLSRRMARRFWSPKRRCYRRLDSPNSPGVAWDKGCYKGQELTAQTKCRGPVKRRLVPVELSGPGATPGTKVMAEGQEVGDLRSCPGRLALAMLRLNRRGEGARRWQDAGYTAPARLGSGH